MLKKRLDNFDLQQITDSGQCFRMERLGENLYCVIADGNYLEIGKRGTETIFYCAEEEFEVFWKRFFDLEEDYGHWIASVDKQDGYLCAAVEHGGGIRILRQELWEVTVSFIISQQNNIPRIRKSVDALCRRFGERKESGEGREYYAFPTPQALADAEEEALKACGLGYRARYIRQTAEMVVRREVLLQELPSMEYDAAVKELMRLSGVGRKVADCICLFALHHVEAFPVDTHISAMLAAHYPEGFPFGKYEGYAGVLQQYAFYYEVTGKKKAIADH